MQIPFIINNHLFSFIFEFQFQESYVYTKFCETLIIIIAYRMTRRDIFNRLI